MFFPPTTANPVLWRSGAAVTFSQNAVQRQHLGESATQRRHQFSCDDTTPRSGAREKGSSTVRNNFFSAEHASWPDATSSTTKCDGDVRGTTSRRVRERARRTGRCGSTAPGTGAALKKKGIHVRYVPDDSLLFVRLFDSCVCDPSEDLNPAVILMRLRFLNL